jgi:hypothetical protein
MKIDFIERENKYAGKIQISTPKERISRMEQQSGDLSIEPDGGACGPDAV